MASRTLLQIIQDFTAERGLKVPSTVIGNTDKQVVQLLALMQAFCRDMVTRKAFQHNTVECTHTTLALEDQGDIDTIAASGFEGILLDTVFNRTTRLKLAGGVKPDEWQARKALNFTGPLYQFRLRQNKLLMIPVPTAGQTIAFEYLSSWFVKTAAGSLKKLWTVDTDWCILGDELPMAYLGWRWPQSKGFEYAEAFRQYEELVGYKLGRSNAPTAVNLACNSPAVRPGIVVSPGSWDLP